MGTRLSTPAVVASILVVLLLAAVPPAGADASDLLLDDDAVDVGTALSGTVVDGPADDGNRIVVSLDADGDGVYDNGEPQVRISSDDAGTALPWSGLETDGLSAGNYTVYAVETQNVKNKDVLSGATATVGVVDPPPTISNFRVSNPSGGDVVVEFESSEPLATVSASIAGPETATLATADFAESGSGPYQYEATYVAATPGNYTATLDVAIDAGGNDGAGGESASVYVSLDSTPPDLQAAETADPDRDGTVDEVSLRFTEPVDDGSLDADDFSIADGTVTAVSTGAAPNDDVAVLSVSGLPPGDTSLAPQVVLRPRRVSDLAGNDGPSGATSVVATDGAAPVILAATTGNADDDGRIDRLNATLSEPVVDGSLRADDYDVGGTAYAGETIVAYTIGDRHVHLGFDEGGADDTGATPSISYTRGTTVDAAGNPMENATFTGTADGVAPTLVLSTANPSTDGFDVQTRLSEAASTTYVVIQDGAAPPSAAQVLLGQNATDDPAIRWGTIQVPAAGVTGSASVSGLASDSAYDVYAVATDSIGNRRAPPVAADAGTLEPPPDTDDGGSAGGRRGTSVRAKLGPGDRVEVEIRNPRTGRPVSAPLGGIGSSGIVYRRVTFDFHTAVDALEVRLVPGERELADPPLAGARVLEYFTVRRLDDGPSPLTSVTFEVRVRESALPAGSGLDDVSFYRFDDGEWGRLESRRGGETFYVTTGGFSSFAVAVPEAATPPPQTPVASPTATPATDAPTGTTTVPTPPATETPGPPTTGAAQRAGDPSAALGVSLVLLLTFLLVSRLLPGPRGRAPADRKGKGR